MNKFLSILVILFTGISVVSCGEAYNDGTDNGTLKDWGYPSRYRGSVSMSRAFSLDTRKEIASSLVEAIDYGNSLVNKGYHALNTPLLLDNLTQLGVNAPHYDLEESGNCSSTPGKKIYNTNTFSWGGGFFRSTIKYNNYCLKGLGTSEKVVINGGTAFEDEEFDNTTTATVRSVYSETTLDNVSIGISSAAGGTYTLFGIMKRNSDRSRDATDNMLNVDKLKAVHFGLDMPKGDTVYRFDIYDNKTSGAKYIDFYHPSWGFVTVDLAFLKTDHVQELDYVTIKFYDNETCTFTKLDLSQDKPNQYPRRFNCKKKTYEPEEK